jgi:hypothetical protein
MWVSTVSRNNPKTKELILNYNKVAVDMKALFTYKFAYILYIVLERGTHGLINYIDTREKCRHLKKFMLHAAKSLIRTVFLYDDIVHCLL